MTPRRPIEYATSGCVSPRCCRRSASARSVFSRASGELLRLDVAIRLQLQLFRPFQKGARSQGTRMSRQTADCPAHGLRSQTCAC